MRTFALDTETRYSKEYSVADMDVWHYTHDPRFECYMLTIAGDDGYEYAGPPEEFDWSLLDGPDVTVVSHNRAFDKTVVDRLVELGKIPAFTPGAWWCSADCAAYHGLPRALAGAVKDAFGVSPDKTVRDKMKGREFHELNAEDRKELIDYAVEDARLCLRLWLHLSPTWPDAERWISAHTGDIGVRGLPVDKEALEAGVAHLSNVMWKAEQNIPWKDEHPILSPKALALECRKAGIEPPSSLAKDSEECAAWEDKYGDQYPWVGAMRDYRRGNTLKLKLETILKRIREDTGRACFSLKYFGAGITGRWSGGGGYNVQNMGRGEILGVDLRKMFKAPEGKTFVISDLSQIEPRILTVISGNNKLLDAMRSGLGIYEAHAVSTGMWDPANGSLKSNDAKTYAAAKAQLLALGYGAGAKRFQQMSPLLTGGQYCPDEAEAEKTVALYRARNPEVTKLWQRMEAALRGSLRSNLEIELASGRVIRYQQITSIGGMTGLVPRGGKLTRSKLYGPHIVENLCQGMARDIFAHHMKLLHDAGYDIQWHVHDEVILLVDEDKADEAVADVERIMSIPPAWMPGIPLAAEAKISKVYTK